MMRGGKALVWLVLAIVAFSSCAGPDAEDFAVDACNDWAGAVEPDKTRQGSFALLNSAISSAERAARIDEEFEQFETALRAYKVSAELQDVETLASTTDDITDTCFSLPQIEEQMREEIERLRK